MTSDVLFMDAAADGSILVNLRDRPGEVVSFPPGGGQASLIAGFPQLGDNDIVVALPDGRAVIPVQDSGSTRRFSSWAKL